MVSYWRYDSANRMMTFSMHGWSKKRFQEIRPFGGTIRYLSLTFEKFRRHRKLNWCNYSVWVWSVLCCFRRRSQLKIRKMFCVCTDWLEASVIFWCSWRFIVSCKDCHSNSSDCERLLIYAKRIKMSSSHQDHLGKNALNRKASSGDYIRCHWKCIAKK